MSLPPLVQPFPPPILPLHLVNVRRICLKIPQTLVTAPPKILFPSSLLPYDSVPSSASAPSDTPREANSETSRTQPANSETTPQSIQPTTKTITPAKSTLVEESDSDSNEPHDQVPQLNSEHADDEDVFSEVDDHQDESFQKRLRLPKI